MMLEMPSAKWTVTNLMAADSKWNKLVAGVDVEEVVVVEEIDMMTGTGTGAGTGAGATDRSVKGLEFEVVLSEGEEITASKSQTWPEELVGKS